ncbi:MAG TPA: choice-of-anchor B family protein [Candidatus Polarisedimenticolaceae bacterium]
MRRLLAAAAVVCLSAVAFAGPNTECPELPPDFAVEPWQPIKLGDLSLRIGLDYVPGDANAPAAESAGPRWRVSLLANDVDPATGEPLPATIRKGLEASFRLTDGEGSVLASGSLVPSWTSRGPAYATEIPSSSLGTAGSTDLTVGVNDPADDVTPDHDGGGSEHGGCDWIPEGTEIDSRLELGALVREGLESLQTGSEAGNNFRMLLKSSMDPRPLDNYSNIWGWNDGTTYLAIIGSSSGTVFVDVTNPEAPVEVGFVAGPNSSWREIKTYKSYAYIVTEGTGTTEGLQIVSLANPLSPQLVNTWTITMRTSHTLFIDETNGRLYLNGTNAGLRILSLEPDPASPTEIGSWNVRYVHDSYGVGSFMCFAEINNGLQEIYDATDPQNLVQLGSWQTPGRFTHNCWANPDRSLLVTTDENNPGGGLAVYDISTLTPGIPPPQLAFYKPVANAVVHNAYFEDGDPRRVAMSHYGIGARLIDLRRPTKPVELGAYDTYLPGDTGYNGAWGMYNYDPRGYFYISDIQGGLFVLQHAPTGGTLSGVVRDATSGQPVAGAKVVALADGTADTTGADGVYALYAPEGALQLRVTAPGYRSAILAGGSMPLDGRVDLDFALERLPQVGLGGVVRRSDTNAAVAGARVAVAGTALSATTAADGSYAFAEVPIGQRTVTASAFGFASAEVRVVLAEAGAATADLALEPGLFVDDAETAKGWSLGVVGDTASSGVWTRVDPMATGGGAVQPENDASPAPGVTAFITGQAAPGANPETNDVDGGPTTLLSPTVNLASAGAARVGYQRWLSNNAGTFSGGRLLAQVSFDNGAAWINLESQSSNANAWTRREFDLGSLGSLTAQTRFRFRAEPVSPYSLSVLEAGVDDVEVVRACRKRFNPEGADSDADGGVDGCDACRFDSGDDADADGICGDVDNAPFASNAGQADADGDGVGDAADNCAGASNPEQRDLDLDGAGDACDGDLDGDDAPQESDPDDDGDGVADLADNCADAPNAGQADRDADGTGDACDAGDGEVQGVRFASATRLAWESESGSTEYHVYRGDLGAAALVRLAACLAGQTKTTYHVDGDEPQPGDGVFYLVTRVVGTIEGPLGRATTGQERSVDTRCP